jgi:hypothetical protein
MGFIWENAAKIGGIAEGFTAFFALLGVVIAGWTIGCARRSQREATAKDVYRDYLRLAFENPKLANPHAQNLKGDVQKQDEQRQGQQYSEEYRWFVAFMMNSCDEIARSRRGDEGWRNTILEDLKMHAEYLKSREFAEDGGWRLYSPELKDIYDQL